MRIDFILNGKNKSYDCDPDDNLLTILRKLGCNSVRQGCDTSNCGICTVWIDNRPFLSCSYPAARINGHSVTTIEGVRKEAEDLMQAFANEGADQCGYCSPGLIMTILALLKENNCPTDEEINHYLAGNLCRCTGYLSQMRAIHKVIESRSNQNAR